MEQQNSYKNHWCYRTLTILLFLVLLSFWTLSGILAKYTSVTVKDDFARVASFSVEAIGETNNPELLLTSINQISSDYKITLTNDSEVAVSYQVILTFDESLPKGIVLKLDDKEPSVSDDRKTFTFEVIKGIEVNSSKEVILHFQVDNLSFLDNEVGMKYETSLDFHINVKFVQID